MANLKYAIWDKTSDIFTPSGERFTPEEWISRYSWINAPIAVPVIAAGLMNGAFSGELSQMKQLAEMNGATFDSSLSNEELLDAIAEFEDHMNTPSSEPTSEERIAAALEYQNVINS